MAGVIYLILIVLIVGGVGALFYLNVIDTPAPIEQGVQGIHGFLVESKCYADGSCVELLIDDKKHTIDGEPVDQKVTQKQVVINEETGKGSVQDVTYTIEGHDDIPQIRKDNPSGVVVQGYVKLMDATTGNPMKPYIYNVLVQIECAEDLNEVDGFDYCSTSPIFGRVTTDDGGKDENGVERGGYFKYVWHPKFTDSLAFYDVSVLVTSDQLNSAGRYENYENKYQIQVIQ